MGINQRVSLRKFIDDIRRWVDEDRSDEWIASALGTSPSSVQSFRSRNAIYRRHATSSTLPTAGTTLFLRRGARAGKPRCLVRPRDRQRPPLAQTLEEHREGRTAPHTDQDRLPEARGRQGPGGEPLASISARSRLPPLPARHLAAFSICSRNVPDPAVPVASVRRPAQESP